MNILILNWRDPKNPKSGGAEIVTMEHAKAWVAAGNNVTWLSSMFDGASKSEIINNVYIIRKGSIFGIYFWSPIFCLFSKKKFDIVIDEIHGVPFFTPFYIKRSKIIVFIHEVAGEIWDYMYRFPINSIGKLFERFMYAPYKNIPFITVSDSTRRDLKVLGMRNITIIENGIDIQVSKNRLQKEQNPTFIFVSRIVKMKGIERVLAAFRYILEKEPKAQLWIVGTGEKKYIRYLQSKEDDIQSHIQFFGKVSEDKKYELLSKAHILLHASVKEGWGLVIVEAASMGTPAVVYNVAGLRDSVKNNTTGIVLERNSPKNLAAQALLLLANKKRYNLFRENCLTWSKSLTWKKATKKSLEFLEFVRNK